MNTKLTYELLLKLGFIGEGKSILNTPLYRLKWSESMYLFQIELHPELPEDNQNSSIVSLYFPELKNQHVMVYDKIENKGKTKK